MKRPVCKLIVVLSVGVLACGLVACSQSGSTMSATSPSLEGATAVAQPTYPEKPDPDDYEAVDNVYADNQVDDTFVDELSSFAYRSAAEVLKEADAGVVANENYAPISLYYALAMTQLGASGTTADEIQAVLGSTDAQITAQQCGNLLRLLAVNPQADIKLANSIWMRPDTAYKQDFIDTASSQFYASLFTVDFGTPEADQALGAWISQATEGTIAPEVKTQEGQLLSIINTIYFKSAWANAFDAEATKMQTFHASDGDVDASFMSQRVDKPQEYRTTDTYTRASLSFMDGSQMVFVLPSEGVDVRTLATDAAALEEAFTAEETDEAFITYQLPKFSFDRSYGLIPSLEKMGMTTAFGDDADFSNLSNVPAYVSSILQESHIGLDENGVEASAYTKVDIMEMSAMPDPEVVGEFEFNLNRPFLYEIRSAQGAPLFVGVCANPVVA